MVTSPYQINIYFLNYLNNIKNGDLSYYNIIYYRKMFFSIIN